MSTKRIAKATSRGQITLPKKWRDKFKTDQYILTLYDYKIEVTPLLENELDNARKNIRQSIK